MNQYVYNVSSRADGIMKTKFTLEIMKRDESKHKNWKRVSVKEFDNYEAADMHGRQFCINKGEVA